MAMTNLCNAEYSSDDEVGKEEEYSSEEEQPSGPLAAITSTAVRHGFIRKVYSILFIQLLLTTVVAAIIMKVGNHLRETNPGLVQFMLYTSMAGTLGMVCCCQSLLKTSPQNYVFLLVFTLLESILIGFICTMYTAGSVLFVTAITAFVVGGLTLFACQTKYDFTGCGPYLFCALLVLMGFGLSLCIASMFGFEGTPGFETLQMIYAGCGTLLFSFFIVYDTQKIVGGKHKKHQYNVDDYCFAALSLYLDIINLFLFLLQLLGSRN